MRQPTSTAAASVNVSTARYADDRIWSTIAVPSATIQPRRPCASTSAPARNTMGRYMTEIVWICGSIVSGHGPRAKTAPATNAASARPVHRHASTYAATATRMHAPSVVAWWASTGFPVAR